MNKDSYSPLIFPNLKNIFRCLIKIKIKIKKLEIFDEYLLNVSCFFT